METIPTFIKVVHSDSTVYSTYHLVSSWVEPHAIHWLSNLQKKLNCHHLSVFYSGRYGQSGILKHITPQIILNLKELVIMNMGM